MKSELIKKGMLKLMLVLVISWTLSFSACSTASQSKSDDFRVNHPAWLHNATIYEVNIRQFTPEGTFNAFAMHLPRLKELGVDILWLMPIHPIGQVNRKGTLGSYYSIKDYKAVNPEFGTMEDFKALVAQAQSLGFKVILDWVANHTSHDNPLVYSNPEWYDRDSVGNLISPFDWTDVLQLNYDSPELRDYMIGALKFWVQEANIDGYRCDVAYLVPTDFWERARQELDAIKPVFLLAEAEEPELQRRAFNADYAWEFHHLMTDIANGKKSVVDIEKYFVRELARYPKNTIKMHFTSNHDENSWKGTEFERLGKGAKAFAALTFVINGIPLMYNGQEVGFNRRLQFFEKDEIEWVDAGDFTPFYQKLTGLKRDNSALAAGAKGADMERVKTSNDVNIFAFVRKNKQDKVFAIFNLSPLEQTVSLVGTDFVGEYRELFSDENVSLTKGQSLDLKPWDYRIYVK